MFVLIHSPLVGPYTWTPVADRLQQRGVDVVVPKLHERFEEGALYWAQYADAAARMLTPDDPAPVVLVAHSGAGALLPAIRELMERPVAAYLFVDAGIPENGKSWLELVKRENA